MVKIGGNKWIAELTHYVVVFAVILASWIPLMNYFQNDVGKTALSALVVFIIADQLAHKIILKENFSMW